MGGWGEVTCALLRSENRENVEGWVEGGRDRGRGGMLPDEDAWVEEEETKEEGRKGEGGEGGKAEKREGLKGREGGERRGREREDEGEEEKRKKEGEMK